MPQLHSFCYQAEISQVVSLLQKRTFKGDCGPTNNPLSELEFCADFYANRWILTLQQVIFKTDDFFNIYLLNIFRY